jgi:hypothetical protein
MGAACLGLSEACEAWLGVSSLGSRLAQVGGSVALGIMVFVLASRLLALRELEDVFALLPLRSGGGSK